MTSSRPRSEQDRMNQRSVLGTVLFLVSLGMAFGALFVLYAWLRASMPAWPPTGLARPPLTLSSINTAVALLSSVTYHGAVRALDRGRRQRFRLLLLATANLGAIFLLLQLLLARQAASLNIYLGESLYAALLYGLAAFHAIHLLVGVIAVVILSIGVQAGRFSSRDAVQVRLWGYYWHFVSVCWVVMYAIMFVL